MNRSHLMVSAVAAMLVAVCALSQPASAQPAASATSSSGMSAKQEQKAQRKAERQARRAKKNAELNQLEKNGYNPAREVTTPGYPQDIDKAEARTNVQKPRAASTP